MPDMSAVKQRNTSGSTGPLAAMTPALRRKLHRHCARMAGSLFDGEDILHDALLKAHETSGPAAGFENPEGWLFRVVHRTALDFLRRRSRSPVVVDSVTAAANEPRETNGAESRWAVAAGLRTFMRLTVGERSAVILSDVLDHSLVEVATLTGRSLAGTKSALLRGRRHLRQIASEVDAPRPAHSVSKEDIARLESYARHFNARDFDSLGDLIVEEVQAELVASTTIRGKTRITAVYYGNYSKLTGWTATAAIVDDKPAVVVYRPGETTYVIELGFSSEGIFRIRDFRHAGYDLMRSEVLVLSCGEFEASAHLAGSIRCLSNIA